MTVDQIDFILSVAGFGVVIGMIVFFAGEFGGIKLIAAVGGWVAFLSGFILVFPVSLVCASLALVIGIPAWALRHLKRREEVLRNSQDDLRRALGRRIDAPVR